MICIRRVYFHHCDFWKLYIKLQMILKWEAYLWYQNKNRTSNFHQPKTKSDVHLTNANPTQINCQKTNQPDMTLFKFLPHVILNRPKPVRTIYPLYPREFFIPKQIPSNQQRIPLLLPSVSLQSVPDS